jgi:hypothetical protein
MLVTLMWENEHMLVNVSIIIMIDNECDNLPK